MKWLRVKLYISDVDLFIRYDDIDYIVNDKEGIVTTLYMKNGKAIHINKVDSNSIKHVLENDK